MRVAPIVAVLVIGSGLVAASERRATSMEITLTTSKNETIRVRLNDSAAARDFLSLLPLKLPFKDYARTEKVSDLPRKLSTRGAPAGIDPSVGDFTYYARWGNLALFYRDFGYSNGLVALGRVESGNELLAQLDGEVLIEEARH